MRVFYAAMPIVLSEDYLFSTNMLKNLALQHHHFKHQYWITEVIPTSATALLLFGNLNPLPFIALPFSLFELHTFNLRSNDSRMLILQPVQYTCLTQGCNGTWTVVTEYDEKTSNTSTITRPPQNAKGYCQECWARIEEQDRQSKGGAE